MKLFLLENGIYKPTLTPFPGYLIQRDNINILIDTGITPEDAKLINIENNDSSMEVGPYHLPESCLGKLGIRPEMIDIVINTHFHFDHCGYNKLFCKAKFYVQKDHYYFAKSSNDKAFGKTERYWDHISYELIDGDKEIIPGIHCVRTDGHVIGMQSIVIELKKTGNVLIASDAMRDSRMLYHENPCHFSMFDSDDEKVNEGVRKLERVIKEKSINLVIFNHDGLAWPTYRKSPDFYE